MVGEWYPEPNVNPAGKFDALRQIQQEDKFRQNVLMPLFAKMELHPVSTHGTVERGKDIVCFEISAFGFTEWIAIVAKVGKITGSTSASAGFTTVLNQTLEAFHFSYDDPVSKKKCPINKIIVVTNDELSPQAKEKIVAKLGQPGAADANVHFLDGHKVAELIDQYWSDFWDATDWLLSDEDYMSQEAGLVLYVLARSYLQSKSSRKKKVRPDLSRDQIRVQTHLSKMRVDVALTYMLQAQYAQEKRKLIRLHAKKTVGYLLMKPDQIRVLFAARDIADEQLHFTEDALVGKCKKEPFLQFRPAFVKETLAEFAKGGSDYIHRDQARGPKHYKLEIDTITEERPYLECWLRYQGGVPTKGD